MVEATERTKTAVRFRPQFRRHSVRRLGGKDEGDAMSTQGCTLICNTTCLGCCDTERTCGTDEPCSTS